ncbi:MAG: hypothetical protein HY735_06135 [Verrucomicrobia bacterium]|nr:hypothetical protein [Verrucomicrobiota bacterium]
MIAAPIDQFSAMSKPEILSELPKLTLAEREEIRLKRAELDGNDWLDEEDPLIHQRKGIDRIPHRSARGKF